MPSRRSSEAKSFNAAVELCDAFVVASPQVSGVPEEQLLVFLYPGLPTSAELFILPDENNPGEHKKDSEEALETVRRKKGKRRNVKKCVVKLFRCAVLKVSFLKQQINTFTALFSVTLFWRESYVLCSILTSNHVKQ